MRGQPARRGVSIEVLRTLLGQMLVCGKRPKAFSLGVLGKGDVNRCQPTHFLQEGLRPPRGSRGRDALSQRCSFKCLQMEGRCAESSIYPLKQSPMFMQLEQGPNTLLSHLAQMIGAFANPSLVVGSFPQSGSRQAAHCTQVGHISHGKFRSSQPPRSPSTTIVSSRARLLLTGFSRHPFTNM